MECSTVNLHFSQMPSFIITLFFNIGINTNSALSMAGGLTVETIQND